MKLWVTFALFAFGLAIAGGANAQMSEGERKAAARAAYAEGVQLQDKGQPADALARFEAAQKLYDAPTHLLHIAECQALTGRLVEASETYETLSRKPLDKSSPQAFLQAQEQGKAEQQQLRPRIPSMRVNVKPDPSSLQNLQIMLNDRQMPNELVGLSRPVNPGSYRLSATATGWATPAPVDVEIKEGEPKVVELTLKQGGAGAAAAPPGAVVVPPSPSPLPPERTAPPPKPGPSQVGLLVGGRVGVFVPSGDIAKGRKFNEVGSAGPGFGVDVMIRVARLFLFGGTVEFATLGGPAASTIDERVRVSGTTNTLLVGLTAGIMPNVDKVTFVADAGLGYRLLWRSQTRTPKPGVTGVDVEERDETFGGLELALNAGLAIPVGNIRIVPKAGLGFGTFSASGTSTNPSATTSADAYHLILNAVLGLYYHFDLAKKPQGSS